MDFSPSSSGICFVSYSSMSSTENKFLLLAADGLCSTSKDVLKEIMYLAARVGLWVGGREGRI